MKIRTFIISTSILLAAIPLRAEIDASILLTDSPFVPVGWSPNGKGLMDASQQYTFKGVYSIGEDTFISIANSSSGKSDWIEIGETKNGVKALSYDQDSRKATIVASGRELTLEIPKSKGNSAPVGAAVNSLARKKNAPVGDASPHKNPRDRRMLATPPWANKNGKASGTVAKANKTSKNQKSSSASSSDTSSDTGSSDTGSSDTGSGDTGSGDETTTPSIPAAPPSYVPTIPSDIKTMIESGQAPSK